MTWEDRAACRRTPYPDAFFELENAADDNRAPDLDAVRFAIRTCESCPVRDACIERADATRDVGIWGGTLARERGRPYGSGKWWRNFGVGPLLDALRRR